MHVIERGLLARMSSLLVFFLLCSSAVAQFPEFHYVQAREHDIHLDLPPEQRWTEIVSHYKSSAHLIIRYFSEQVPDYLLSIMEIIGGDVDKYLGDYGREMRGIADAFDVPLGAVVALNFGYELRRLGPGHPNITGDDRYEPKACTSIVAQDADGRIFHGRNMDWNVPDYLKNLTIKVNAYHGSQKVFSATTFVGYVGVMTGVKPGVFSVSLNERSLGGAIISNVLEDVLFGTITVTHLVRQVLEQEKDYTSALNRLIQDRITAPAYFITAGTEPGQGGVITRGRNTVEGFWPLGTVPQPLQADHWYVLETNYDYWKTPPPTDDRRRYGLSMMNKRGRDAVASMDGLWQVLTTWPILNRYTTYTTLMDPANDTMKSFIDFYPAH